MQYGNFLDINSLKKTEGLLLFLLFMHDLLYHSHFFVYDLCLTCKFFELPCLTVFKKSTLFAMKIDSLPVHVFSLIKDYLICFTTQPIIYNQIQQNARSWMNFCNSSKRQQEIKSSFSCYFLSSRNSLAYLSYYKRDFLSKSFLDYFSIDYDLISALVQSCQVNSKINLFLDFSSIVEYEYLEVLKNLDNWLVTETTMNFYCVVSLRWMRGARSNPPLSRFPSLNCYSTDFQNRNIPDVHACASIPYLAFSYCLLPKDIHVFLSNVKEINLSGTCVEDVSCLKNAHTIILSDCQMLVDVSMLGNVYELDISSCQKIQDISSLGNVTKLSIQRCFYIDQGLPPDSTTKHLTFSSHHLSFVSRLRNDVKQKKLSFFNDSINPKPIEMLDKAGFTNIDVFMNQNDSGFEKLSNLHNIRVFYVKSMRYLVKVCSFSSLLSLKLEELETLPDIIDCPILQYLSLIKLRVLNIDVNLLAPLKGLTVEYEPIRRITGYSLSIHSHIKELNLIKGNASPLGNVVISLVNGSKVNNIVTMNSCYSLLRK
jgi:hypothetical protein